VDNTERLPEFFHTAQVSVVAIAVDTDRDIELDLIVGIIRLALPDVPGNTRSSQHDTGEREVKGLSRRYDAYTSQSLDPNTVVCKHLFGLIDTVTKLGSPLVNIVKQTNGNILVDTTGSDISGMQTCSGNTLVELLQLHSCALAFSSSI
jgi:hypothetical protein